MKKITMGIMAVMILSILLLSGCITQTTKWNFIQDDTNSGFCKQRQPDASYERLLGSFTSHENCVDACVDAVENNRIARCTELV